MAPQKKKKWPRQLTQTAEARYPHLNEPDDRFGDPVYKTDLIFGSRDEAAELIELIEQRQQEAIAMAVEEAAAKGKKVHPSKIKLANLPIKMEEDDDGDETGRVIIGSFKTKARGTTSDNKVWERKLPLFDSKGKPVDRDAVSIWGGSRVKLSFIAEPFYTAALGAGVTLRLEAVQIIELRSGGNKTADSFGFGAEEGYEAEEAPTMPSADTGYDYTSADGEDDIPF